MRKKKLRLKHDRPQKKTKIRHPAPGPLENKNFGTFLARQASMRQYTFRPLDKKLPLVQRKSA